MNREILNENMSEMLRNNPPDVVFSAFSRRSSRVRSGSSSANADIKSIVLTDPQARDQAIRHFFNRALREVRDPPLA